MVRLGSFLTAHLRGCGPRLGPFRSLIDPRPQETDLLGGKPFSNHRHDRSFLQTCHQVDQPAPGAVARLDDSARVAARQCGLSTIQPQPAHLLPGPVADLAPLAEEGRNVPRKVNFFLYRRGQCRHTLPRLRRTLIRREKKQAANDGKCSKISIHDFAREARFSCQYLNRFCILYPMLSSFFASLSMVFERAAFSRGQSHKEGLWNLARWRKPCTAPHFHKPHSPFFRPSSTMRPPEGQR